MPVKPSANEEEYFARQEAERRRNITESQARLKTDEGERNRALHFMRCPKCGMPLEEVVFGDVRVDKCLGCEGIWLDKGELEILQTKETGFGARMLSVFRR